MLPFVFDLLVNEVLCCYYFAFLVQEQASPVQFHEPQRSFAPRSKQSAPPLQLQVLSEQLKLVVTVPDVPCAGAITPREGATVGAVCAMSVPLLSITKATNTAAAGPYRSFIVIPPHAPAEPASCYE
jgi:hypothetical protein